MVRKSFLLVILFAFVSLSSGCVTVYSDGCCSGKPCAPKTTAKVTTEKGPGLVKQADNWVKENLW